MQNQIRTMADMGELSEGDIEVGEEYNEEEAEEVEHDENSESSEEEQDELAYDGDIEVDEAGKLIVSFNVFVSINCPRFFMKRRNV